MNIVKRFFKNHNSYSTDESTMIPSGQLYLVRSPSSPKSENECLYNDAILTIRETNHQFNYQLVVWKGNSSDSDSLSGDDEEDSDVNDNFFENDSNILKSFLIDSSLSVCLFERYDQKIISWRDMEGDLGDMFEYRITSTVPNDTIEQFMTAIYKCKYERKYQKSSVAISSKDIQEFVIDRNQIFDSYLNSANTPSVSSTMNINKLLSSQRNIEEEVEFAAEGDSDEDEGEETLSYDSNSEEEEIDPDESDSEFVDASETPSLSHEQLNARILISSFPCKTFSYDAEIQSFKPISGDAIISLFEISNWNYCFEVKNRTDNKVYASSIITEQLDPSFKFEQYAFLFNIYSRSSATTWLVKFDDRETYESYQSGFMKLNWQYKNKTVWPTKKEDEEYLIESLDAMDIDESESQYDNEEEEDEEEEKPVEKSSTFTRKTKKKTKYTDEYDDSDNDEEQTFNKSTKNSGLALGLSTDRAFISRSNKLGVFRTDDEGIDFIAAIDKLSYSKNSKKEINPTKMMLMDNDRVMIVQDKKKLNNLHKIDLEYGKVVEDWEMAKDDQDINIESFTTNKKIGDLSSDPTFLGVSSQSMFRVDPRMNKGFISDESKTYKTKVNFKEVSTTGGGYIAVASENGEIRLYDQLAKNAKTLLPALGDKITGLSISADGRYLLATCPTYLLLIDVMIPDGKYKDSLGFTRSFPAASKPKPRRLTIRPEHLAYIKQNFGQKLSYSQATFNETSTGGPPTYIVSSIGPCAITWKFNDVINNITEKYKIRKYQDNVVMGDFINQNNKHMVFALADNVALASTSSFRQPKDEFSVVKTAF